MSIEQFKCHVGVAMRRSTMYAASVAFGCVALLAACGESATDDGAEPDPESGVTPGGSSSSGSPGAGATSGGNSGATSGGGPGATSGSGSGGGPGATTSGGGPGATTSGSGSGGSSTGDPTLVGFAAHSADGLDTTTGGAGGEVVTVTSYAALAAAIGDHTPRVIRISGTIAGPADVEMLDVGSNKTLIGLGTGATIDGFGLDINGWTPDLVAAHGVTCDPDKASLFTHVSNVIIRNLTFINSTDDSINVQCYSHHVWVDHNTFRKSYDGSVDVKRGSDWVTVSWNHFVETDKTMLLGHDDSNGPQDTGRLHVTYHHNWLDHTVQRNPRVRFGQAHVFNNFANEISDYVIGLGTGASVHAEGNYVDTVKRTSKEYGGTDLTWTDTNIVVETLHGGVENGKGFDPTAYYAISADPAADIPAIVMSQAGAGKLTGME
ncbi:MULTISPECIES: pectate lyase family protein [Sorangium]|uniref:pectate lyase family protein n=1 Tax=Sorangium TaxID=39643 RepID=UPI003D9C0773